MRCERFEILSRRALAWLVLALAPAFACAQATSPAFAIGAAADASKEANASSWTVSVSGEWATRCPPTLQTVSLSGAELRIDSRSMLDLCERAVTPFSIEVNPALALRRDALAAGVYHVSFYAADGAQSAPRLRAFALLDRSAPGSATVVPETGFWWSAGDDRSLLSLDLQDGQLSAALLSFDTAGQPSWLFGTAAYDGRIAQIPLLRLSGGNEPFAATSSAPTGSTAMTLDLEFSASGRAQGWLTRPRGSDGTLQLQHMSLTRLPLAENADASAWQGEWILVDDAAGQAPRRLRLERLQGEDGGHFTLSDASANALLSCVQAAAPSTWPPQDCELRIDGVVAGHFDSIAISRMDGRSASESNLHLLRVTP